MLTECYNLSLSGRPQRDQGSGASDVGMGSGERKKKSIIQQDKDRHEGFHVVINMNFTQF